MSQGPRYRMPFKRRRLGITDYRKRKKLLKSRKIRAIIRRSLKYITVQFAKYDEKGDHIILGVTSKELEKYGWNGSKDTVPAAYLTGILAGKRAIEKGINECIPDIGRYTASRGSRVFAVVKGLIDAGLRCPCDESVFPSEDRIKGEHLPKKPDTDVFEIRSRIMGEKDG
ncbi:MAG TPA: 50S ribosomal protein L18 [Thermoplasmatales archaeon]|nr:50S ribosomal protein L18 [Thermoplasmatales archaeon]HEX16934.1 50S ribosomal protein L18 [Thermoplasmatales archaeon]